MIKKRVKNLFVCKKGISHDIFFNVIEIVLALIVMLALSNFVNDVAEQKIFEKNYLARDLAILINTLYSAPGDIVYNYDENSGKSKFIFRFMPNKVEVDEKEDVNKHEFYPFAENKNIPFKYKTLENDEKQIEFVFTKSAESIDISSSP